MDHVVLAVSYMSELLEREMRVQEQRVRMASPTVIPCPSSCSSSQMSAIKAGSGLVVAELLLTAANANTVLKSNLSLPPA